MPYGLRTHLFNGERKRRIFCAYLPELFTLPKSRNKFEYHRENKKVIHRYTRVQIFILIYRQKTLSKPSNIKIHICKGN